MAITLKQASNGELQRIQVSDSLQADSFERLAGSGNLIIGSTLSGSEELRLGSATTALTRTLGDAQIDGMLELNDGAPILRINETDGGTNEKVWDLYSVAGDLKLSTLTDALGAGSDAIVLSRTGITVDAIDLFAEVDMNSNNIENAGSISFRTLQTDSSSSGSVTFDWSTDNKLKITLTENITSITFTAPPGPCNLVLEVVQDTTTRTMGGWPAAVKWPGGTAPTISTGSGDVDILTFFYDGTSYHGAYLQDYS